MNSADIFPSLLVLLCEVECMVFSSCNNAPLCSHFQVSNMVLFVFKNDVSRIVKAFSIWSNFLS